MKDHFFQYTYQLVDPSSLVQSEILSKESVSSKDVLNDREWNNIGNDCLTKKEKNRIYDEIINIIKEPELTK